MGAGVQRAVLRSKGQITLPQQVRRDVGLEEGDDLLVTVQDGRIVLIPASLIPKDQAWFWTEEWQAGEREVEADRAAGRRGRIFHSDEEFLDFLERAVTDDSVIDEAIAEVKARHQDHA